MLQLGGPSMVYVIVRSRQIVKKKKQKKNWLSCHALENSTKSKRESRSKKKECWENDEKTA